MGDHYCSKHHSSYGFIDTEDNWQCWLCYKEDPYFNPTGRVNDTYTCRNLEARMMFVGSHSVRTEVWKQLINRQGNKTRVLAFSREYKYLSRD